MSRAVGRELCWAKSLLVCWLLLAGAWAQVPPVPRDYVWDEAELLSAAEERALNGKLAAFERATSNQFVVALMRQLPEGAEVASYTHKVAQAWGVGVKSKDNGVVLFVFERDRKAYVQVGYGLEGVLPDALCARILREHLTPQMRAGRPAAAIEATVEAIIAVTRGEYEGSGQTMAEARGRRQPSKGEWVLLILGFAVFTAFALLSHYAMPEGRVISGRIGRNYRWTLTRGGGGGGWGSGGGGGFRGGGGSFGGGGAGGSW